MKFGYWRGYAQGYANGQEEQSDSDERENAALSANYERVICVLREQLAEEQALAVEQSRRADGAVDQLLLHLGARAISSVGAQAQEKRIETEARAMSMLNDDPTADRPLGTPGGRYASFQEADLLSPDSMEQ